MVSKTVQRAIEYMNHGGELRVYAGAGVLCRNPPKPGSGVIISDLGRLSVSNLTIRRLRSIGTKKHHRNYKYHPSGDHEKDTFELWETM